MKYQEVKSIIELEVVWNIIKKGLKLPESHPRDLNYYIKVFKKSPDLLIIAKDKEKIAGALFGSFQGKDGALIGELFVAKQYRKKGVGSSLLKKFEENVKNIGKKSILLGALEYAEKFYLKNGYSPRLFIELLNNDRKKKESIRSYIREYKIIWENNAFNYKVILETNRIDKRLQKDIESKFRCSTQYLFYKDLN